MSLSDGLWGVETMKSERPTTNRDEWLEEANFLLIAVGSVFVWGMSSPHATEGTQRVAKIFAFD